MSQRDVFALCLGNGLAVVTEDKFEYVTTYYLGAKMRKCAELFSNKDNFEELVNIYEGSFHTGVECIRNADYSDYQGLFEGFSDGIHGREKNPEKLKEFRAELEGGNCDIPDQEIVDFFDPEWRSYTRYEAGKGHEYGMEKFLGKRFL